MTTRQSDRGRSVKIGTLSQGRFTLDAPGLASLDIADRRIYAEVARLEIADGSSV